MTPRHLAVFPLALGLILAGCSGPGARVHLGYIQTEVSGEMALDSTSLPAGAPSNPSVDIEEDLGVDDSSPSVLLRTELDSGPVRLTASAFQYSGDGQGRLTADFGGIVVGTDVQSELDFYNVKGALTFDVLDAGPVRVSPGIAADVFDLEATVRDTTTGTTETVDEVYPIPMLFLQSELDLGPVGAVVDAGAMDVSYDDFDGTFFDVEALVIVEPVDHVELFAGYRWISIDANGTSGGEDYFADFDIQGWFVGGGVSF